MSTITEKVASYFFSKNFTCSFTFRAIRRRILQLKIQIQHLPAAFDIFCILCQYLLIRKVISCPYLKLELVTATTTEKSLIVTLCYRNYDKHFVTLLQLLCQLLSLSPTVSILVMWKWSSNKKNWIRKNLLLFIHDTFDLK